MKISFPSSTAVFISSSVIDVQLVNSSNGAYVTDKFVPVPAINPAILVHNFAAGYSVVSIKALEATLMMPSLSPAVFGSTALTFLHYTYKSRHI